MKKEYTIGEICALYNIGPDSMRYYEKMGLITPERKKNGYRVYTLQEIWKLNIIKDLRKLDFSVKQIKEYLEDRTVQTTKDLIKKEIDMIQNEIAELSKVQKNLERRLKTLKSIETIEEYEKIKIKKISSRKMVLVKESTSKDEEVDLAFRKLERKNDEKALLFGNKNMGVFISDQGMEKGIYNLYENVFFFVDESEKDYDMILPEGDYLTLIYQGAYKKSQYFFQQLLSYIKENEYSIVGSPMEIYRIDIHETSREKEFITEIQIPITKKV
ncbi:MAG: MerR family transcriptional regulator [Epulopiscium sp.]|nr:MerR family transcriptional regulator [Candidatus Epulonipiscium sp.]